MKNAFRLILCSTVFGLPFAVLAQTAPQDQATPPAQTAPQASPGQVADQKLREQEVGERKQESYTAQGIRFGGFNINPNLELREKFTDNVYSSSGDRRSDYITIINPWVYAKSDFSVHEVEIYGSAESHRYAEYKNESDEIYNIYARGKFDVFRDTWIAIKPMFDRAKEDRGSPDAANGVKPTRAYSRSLELDGEYKPGATWLRFDAGSKAMSFENSILGNGTAVNNHDRDRREDKAGLRAGYEVVPGYFAFVEGRYNQREYDQTLDDGGFNRNSQGAEFRVGASIELTGKLKGDVFVGYMMQEYDDTRFSKLQEPTAGIGLRWNVTPLTTVKTTLQRTVEETTTGSVAGLLQDFIELGIDHELLRNLVVGGSVSLTRSEYRGTSREDDLVGAKLKALYRPNQNMQIGAEYTYNGRDSSRDSGEYLTNTLMAKVVLSY